MSLESSVGKFSVENELKLSVPAGLVERGEKIFKSSEIADN